MRENVEQFKTEAQKEIEELKIDREEFNQWREEEIKENSLDASQLNAINEKDIPDGDFKLFKMYKSKEEDLAWEEYEPIEKKILEALQKKENNSRRVFYKFFSEKLRPKITGKELEKSREKL